MPEKVYMVLDTDAIWLRADNPTAEDVTKLLLAVDAYRVELTHLRTDLEAERAARAQAEQAAAMALGELADLAGHVERVFEGVPLTPAVRALLRHAREGRQAE